jgi:hypothetical protein
MSLKDDFQPGICLDSNGEQYIRTKSQKNILYIFQLDWYLTPLYSLVCMVVGVFDIRIIRLESTIAIVIVVVSISLIFSSFVNALYAMPDHSTGNATTQPLAKDNGTTSNTPSVLRLSSVPSNNGTLSKSEPSTNTKDNTNAATGSNSGTFDTHHGTSVSTGSTTGSTTGNHHKDNSNSHDLAQKIINKIKQKLKVGDVPFP